MEGPIASQISERLYVAFTPSSNAELEHESLIDS